MKHKVSYKCLNQCVAGARLQNISLLHPCGYRRRPQNTPAIAWLWHVASAYHCLHAPACEETLSECLAHGMRQACDLDCGLCQSAKHTWHPSMWRMSSFCHCLYAPACEETLSQCPAHGMRQACDLDCGLCQSAKHTWHSSMWRMSSFCHCLYAPACDGTM
jgi:hypothetical protein